jgi:hypothetical protein
MAIALVQKAAGLSGGGASFAQAYSSNNTQGNLLVCLTRGFSDIPLATINPVVDSQGNTWVLAVTVTLPSDNFYYIYYAANCKGGANTVTVTYASSTNPIVLLGEYSGIATVSPLDQTNSAVNTTGSSSAYSSGSVTTTVANELLIGLTGNESGLATTMTTTNPSWVNEQQERSGTVPDLAYFDLIVSALGSYSNAGTLSVARAWGAGIATFKAAGSGGGPGTGIPPFGWVNIQGDHYNKHGVGG